MGGGPAGATASMPRPSVRVAGRDAQAREWCQTEEEADEGHKKRTKGKVHH